MLPVSCVEVTLHSCLLARAVLSIPIGIFRRLLGILSDFLVLIRTVHLCMGVSSTVVPHYAGLLGEVAEVVWQVPWITLEYRSLG